MPKPAETETSHAPQTPPENLGAEDLEKAAKALNERCQRIMQQFWERQAEHNGFQVPDPLVVGKAFFELGAVLLKDPARLAEAQARLFQSYANLWQSASTRLAGEAAAPVIEPARDDKRFKDQAWSENVVFDTLKQTYLLTSDWVQKTVRDVDGLDAKTRDKVNFYTRQWVDALAPTNFVATNPQVLQKALDTKGENLIRGLDNLLEDLDRGQGQLRISMTDTNAFTLGRNVATTPGKVVFQNDLMQLIQYAPTTDEVFKRPLLIVPPWINKFYVLDLQPKNSFIKWAVDQGHTVFVVSWVNPGPELSHKTFDDYMLEGPLAALDAIKDATGEDKVNVIGYCIGGTLTSSTLAYMAAKGDDRVAAVSFFTTMTDFTEPGELGVFVDEEQLELLEKHMAEKGYLEGSYMSQVFNMMRDNDLIWSFVINNYLLGREPLAFDLLYWNSDSTRMPAKMLAMYLRKMYLENRLVEPGGISLAGVPIDLTKVAVPVYMLSTHDDHIAPWKSTYAATQLYSGPVRFVLSASGHIAGVINPPAANKYCHWTKTGKAPKDPEKWLATATRHDGSWWPDWQKWVAAKAGAKVPARIPGDGKLTVIEDAPGSYVSVRLG